MALQHQRENRWDDHRQALMTHMDLGGGVSCLVACVVMDFDNTTKDIFCFCAFLFAGMWLTMLGIVTSQINKGEETVTPAMPRRYE